jgi:TetR/AcrR family transcriptional regulator, transcriptional repressor for nem operon
MASRYSAGMPRVSKEQSLSNRVTITQTAARLFREQGIQGISVSDLMGAAGLTHGGFYGHFESKGALAAEACRLAFQNSIERWEKRLNECASPDAAKAALAEGYLSAKSRDNPGISCPASSLATDIARQDLNAAVRAEFASGVEALVEILASLQHTGNPAGDRNEGLTDLATMVGAQVLARATSGLKFSDEVLLAARKRLGAPRKRTVRAGAPRRANS